MPRFYQRDLRGFFRRAFLAERTDPGTASTGILFYFARRVYLISTAFHSGTAPKLK
jgi:hypothetical protein